MYFIIEESPYGTSVVGNYNSLSEAQDALFALYNSYCAYYITKIIS